MLAVFVGNCCCGGVDGGMSSLLSRRTKPTIEESKSSSSFLCVAVVMPRRHAEGGTMLPYCSGLSVGAIDTMACPSVESRDGDTGPLPDGLTTAHPPKLWTRCAESSRPRELWPSSLATVNTAIASASSRRRREDKVLCGRSSVSGSPLATRFASSLLFCRLSRGVNEMAVTDGEVVAIRSADCCSLRGDGELLCCCAAAAP